MADQESSNISPNTKQAYIGLNLNSVSSQIKNGELSWALNAVVENFDGNEVSYQNEQANILCSNFPSGYTVIGKLNIIEDNIKIFWLANESTGQSEIGKIVDCEYSTVINPDCLNLDVNHPILKSVYRKNECGEIEIYWVDGYNRTRYINLSQLPYKVEEGTVVCEDVITTEIDCNKLNLQPNFKIPQLDIIDVNSDGELEAGTYQFAVQYADAEGNPYTSFYSVTNPLPIFDPTKITQNFNYKVGKSIVIDISNIDRTGLYEFINLAVIKTVNNISTPELVGTYDITNGEIKITYTGQNKTGIQLSMEDIFLKYEIYDTADDITTAQDTLILKGLTTNERISYQSIANQIKLYWQTWRIPQDRYKDELVATYLKGYMGDEVYPYEIAFLIENGVETDGFHIPGRTAIPSDLVPVSNDDVVDTDAEVCEPQNTTLPYWQVYNTASLLGYEQVYLDFLNGIRYADCPNPKVCGVIDIDPTDPACYSGPFQYGEFAYWESTDTYPCNDIYGELSGKPIRFHKFPDSTIAHIHDNQGFIYPKGLKIDVNQIVQLINNSDLTPEQKSQIKGFKILRGNRANNKSIVAKGLLYNVGKYRKDNKGYYYPNYPFNDLREDPFITVNSNYVEPNDSNGQSGTSNCFEYEISTALGPVTAQYTNCETGQVEYVPVQTGLPVTICSSTLPFFTAGGVGVITQKSYCSSGDEPSDVVEGKAQLKGFETDDSKQRYTFHSPDTHFYQPYIGNILKLETAEYGKAESHFTEVKNHAKYKFLSDTAVSVALLTAVGIGFASNTFGVSTNVFNGTAAYTSFQIMLDIMEKLIPNKNFTYQQTALGEYKQYKIVQNNTGNKQRKIDLGVYLQPGMVNIGDENTINNYQRESSVYLRTTKTLPYVSDVPGVAEDNTRYTLSQVDKCSSPSDISEVDISAYYSSIKKNIPNQYGQLYSYETIDTGFQFTLDLTQSYPNGWYSVFGGDVFINRFALKRKYPFFIDNRVSPERTNMFPNNSDVFYNFLGNVGYPKYWFSTDIRRGSFFGLFGVKDTAFDCKENKFFYDSGKIYLFSYGIPYYFCESEVNVDLRQAYNDKEGDFFPRVSSDIPDDWLQETYVTIKNDNTYYYNKTYSKQNKENYFSHLPNSWTGDECTTNYPYRAIFSEQISDNKRSLNKSAWKIFKPSARFDFPQNYGKLISLDGIENRQVLARFEQKSLLYNAMLTAPTSAANVYLGQSLFNQQVPPLDYADVDLGYMGSQHKFLLKTEYGHVSADAKRGQIFLINGQQTKDITNNNASKFFTEFLDFQIKKSFPDIDIDNHFKGIGLHGVFDSKYNRLIITKLDYKPIKGVTYENGVFKYGGVEVQLTDTDYFCNYSFTASYDFDNQAWISLHTYIPNYYVGDANYFYSGINGAISSIWEHNTAINKFNNFYGEIHPYIIEYPYAYGPNDQILQNIKDYSRVYQYTDFREFVETDDYYFNKLIAYSTQQCSGILNLFKKPANNLKEYSTYPKYNTDSKDITFTKSNSFYQINTFWDMVKSVKSPIWTKSCENISIYKELNQSNLDYSKRSFKKAPLRSKELKLRLILDNRDDIKIISSFIISPTMQSYK